MNIPNSRKPPSFDGLAGHYGWMEAVLAGGSLQRCRTAFLGNSRPERALLVGEGNGRFLEALRTRHPSAHITVVDSSLSMLASAKERIARRGIDASRIDWIHAEIPCWHPTAAAFDLVAANFVLDCFDNHGLAEVAGKLAAACADRARLLVADFSLPENGPARWRAAVLLWAMYRFFQFTTGIAAGRLVDPSPALRAAGFRPVARQTFQAGFLAATEWEFHGPLPTGTRRGVIQNPTGRGTAHNVASPE